MRTPPYLLSLQTPHCLSLDVKDEEKHLAYYPEGEEGVFNSLLWSLSLGSP